MLFRKRWTRFIHAYLPPDCVLYRESATVCIYREWGFVVKFALDQGEFDAELKALQHLAPMDCFPSIIAYGSTSAGLGSSVPFIVITYHGEALCEIDIHTAFVNDS